MKPKEHKEKKPKHIVKVKFRDIKDFDKVHEEGDEIEIEDPERIEQLKDLGLVEDDK